MLIGNKIFPYPILNNKATSPDYKASSFKLLFDVGEEGGLIQKNGNIVFENIRFELDNKELNELYLDNRVVVYSLLECSNTVYRRRDIITKDPISFEVPISFLSNKVTIGAYMIAKEDIECFKSDDFDDIYKGYKFDIEKYDILAADDGFQFRVELEETNDTRLSSIFNIVRKDDAGEEISYLDEGKKISIYVSPEHREQYEGMKRNARFNNVFFSMLVVPALAGCLQGLQSDLLYGETGYDSLDDISETKPWFRSIQKRYKILFGRDMEVEDLKNENCFLLSQRLMNYSSGKGMTDYYNLAFEGEEEYEDE